MWHPRPLAPVPGDNAEVPKLVFVIEHTSEQRVSIGLEVTRHNQCVVPIIMIWLSLGCHIAAAWRWIMGRIPP